MSQSTYFLRFKPGYELFFNLLWYLTDLCTPFFTQEEEYEF